MLSFHFLSVSPFLWNYSERRSEAILADSIKILMPT